MLSPYRVLDLSDDRGIFCSYMLAELGADVVCVEPAGGSNSRQRGPFYTGGNVKEKALGESLHWWAYARNKRSIILDPEVAQDRDALLQLVASADVFIESKKPTAMQRLGLGYQELARINPALIYVSITPFGQTGPKAGWAGTDITVFAAGAALLLYGDADRAPVRISVPQAFAHAGAEAAVATLVALHERTRSGRGQHIDISAQQAVTILTQGDIVSSALVNSGARRAAGGMRIGRMDLRLAFPAADGHVSITLLFGSSFGPPTARLMALVFEEGFCSEALRDKDYMQMTNILPSGDESFDTYEEIKACVAGWTAGKTKAELLSIAMAHGLLIAPALTTREIVVSEQLAQRKFFQPMDLQIPAERGMNGYPQQLGHFAQFGSDAVPPARPAPRLDEHRAQLLAEHRKLDILGSPQPLCDDGAVAEGVTDAASLPLAGVKILDFSWAIAGPMATRVLADYGAEVIRVESSLHPDALRSARPFVGSYPDAENSALFHSCNASKRMLSIDLSKPESHEVILDLVRWADVVCEAFSPGTITKLGFGYETLKAVKSSIIMLSTSLMGQTGELSTFAGYGNLSAAMAGFQELTGWPDREAAGPYGPYTDFTAPKFNALAILSALDSRRRTGKGQFIDLSQAESSMHFLSPALLETLINNEVATRKGNWDEHFAPHGCYPVQGKDRWIAIAVEDDPGWQALCEVIQSRELLHDRRFSSCKTRVENAADLDAIIAVHTLEWDGADLEACLQRAGIACHQLLDSAGAIDDPQLQERGHFVPLKGNNLVSVVENTRSKLSRTPAQIRHGLPTMGRDNQMILSGILGYDEGKIAKLLIAGVLD